MNIAFQAFLLLSFYLPGELFVQALVGRFSEEQELPNAVGITAISGTALVIAALLQFIWSGLTVLLSFVRALNLRSAAPEFWTLFSVGQGTKLYEVADASVRGNLWHMAIYFLSLYAFAIAAGWLAHRTINVRRLAAKYPFLQFKPKWHYLLSGKNNRPQPGCDLDVEANILVELDQKPVIYTGLIDEYWFDKITGALDVITLVDVVRWPRLEAEKTSPAPPGKFVAPCSEDTTSPNRGVVRVRGDAMAIKMSEIKNINIRYIYNPVLRPT
jgi:hypothetical protein